MKRHWSSICALVAGLALTGPANAVAKEIACSSFQGQFNRCPLPGANKKHVQLKQNLGDAPCKKDTSWGADSDGVWVDANCSAVFTYGGGGGQGGKHHAKKGGNQCPSDLKGNECEYYKDGHKAGAQDGKASMSMVYERHADAYDSRFEPYFARGYEAGWKAHR